MGDITFVLYLLSSRNDCRVLRKNFKKDPNLMYVKTGGEIIADV